MSYLDGWNLSRLQTKLSTYGYAVATRISYNMSIEKKTATCYVRTDKCQVIAWKWNRIFFNNKTKTRKAVQIPNHYPKILRITQRLHCWQVHDESQKSSQSSWNNALYNFFLQMRLFTAILIFWQIPFHLVSKQFHTASFYMIAPDCQTIVIL